MKPSPTIEPTSLSSPGLDPQFSMMASEPRDHKKGQSFLSSEGKNHTTSKIGLQYPVRFCHRAMVHLPEPHGNLTQSCTPLILSDLTHYNLNPEGPKQKHAGGKTAFEDRDSYTQH